MRIFYIGILLFAISGCDADISSNDYFPLHKDVTWEYKVTEDLTNVKHIDTYTVTNLGEQSFKQGDYNELTVSARLTSDGTAYYFVQDDTGTHRIAKRTVVELKPRMDPEEIMVLPDMENLTVGMTWSAETRPYALHGLRSHAVPDPRSNKFTLSYEIVSIDSVVDVPAGHFENSIKVEAKGVVGLYADPRLGYQDVNVIHTEWYAPGVGLVKLIREEPMDLDIYKGGTITFELTEFSP